MLKISWGIEQQMLLWRFTSFFGDHIASGAAFDGPKGTQPCMENFPVLSPIMKFKPHLWLGNKWCSSNWPIAGTVKTGYNEHHGTLGH